MQIKQARVAWMVSSLALAAGLTLWLTQATDRGLQAELFGLVAFVLLAGLASGKAPAQRDVVRRAVLRQTR